MRPHTEHVVLVAFCVEDTSPESAQATLINRLVHWVEDQPSDTASVTSWWIAEDHRLDGSDNDSAVFVPLGTQYVSGALLAMHRSEAV